PEKVTARIDIGRAFGATNLFEEAFGRLEDAFALAGDDVDLRALALITEIEVAGRKGDFVRATLDVQKLEALGPIRSSRGLLAASYVRAATGHAAEAIHAIDEAEALDSPDDLMAAVDREKQRVLAY